MIVSLAAQSPSGLESLPSWITFDLGLGRIVGPVAGFMLGISVAVGFAER